MKQLREALFAICLAGAAAAVTHGIYLVSEPAAWICGGILAAGWSWLVLSEAG